jgi:molybdopterin-containing oxidoreductase family membrane subunit
VAGLIRLAIRAILPPVRIIQGMFVMFRETSKTILSVFEDMERSPGFCVWLAFLVALILLGGYALLMSLIHSMEILEFHTNIPWEMMVSSYVFLVGSGVGLCLVSSLGYVFGLQRYEIIGKRALFLALITIIFGLASIGLHLGHPERSAIYNLLTPNLRSAMWYMGVFYPPSIAFIALWYWLLARAELSKTAVESEGLKGKVYRLMALEGLRPYLYQRFHLQKLEAKVYRVIPFERMGLSLDSDGVELRWARVIGTLALIFALLAYTVEGSLFAHMEARPFWYGPLFPIDFLLGASFCGLAWIMAAGILTYRVKSEEIPSKLRDLFYEMAEILALLLSVELLFIAYKMGHGLFEPLKAKTIMLFLNGPFRQAFWLFEIGVGIVAPIGILLFAVRQRQITGILLASIMVLVGYFVKRYDYVVASQVYPVIKNGLPSYLPTFMETLLIAGIIAAAFLTYTLGEKFLPLKEGDKEGSFSV